MVNDWLVDHMVAIAGVCLAAIGIAHCFIGNAIVGIGMLIVVAGYTIKDLISQKRKVKRTLEDYENRNPY